MGLQGATGELQNLTLSCFFWGPFLEPFLDPLSERLPGTSPLEILDFAWDVLKKSRFRQVAYKTENARKIHENSVWNRAQKLIEMLQKTVFKTDLSNKLTRAAPGPPRSTNPAATGAGTQNLLAHGCPNAPGPLIRLYVYIYIYEEIQT